MGTPGHSSTTHSQADPTGSAGRGVRAYSPSQASEPPHYRYDSSCSEVSDRIPVSTLQLFDGSDNGSDYESMDGVRTEDRDTEDDTMEDDEEDDYMMKDLPAVDHGPTESELTYSEPSGGEESDEEQLDEGPLEAGSRWYDKPSERNIARLTECSGLDKNTAKGVLPTSTARDVVVNALASVRFLKEVKEVGQPELYPDEIGIDPEGRLFLIDSSRYRRNHRVGFSDMVSKLEESSRYKEIREHMQTYITARDTDYFSECTHQETANLASLIETVLQEKDIGLATLETVAAECEKVAVTLDKTITLVNAVKQDILDTGSTSLRRWNQLQSMEWNVCRLRHLAEGVPGVPTAAIIDEMVEDITRDVSAWQARLGLTLKLTRDLELAIAGISSS